MTMKTADFTFALADAEQCVPVDSATPITATLPTNAPIAFPVGATVKVRQANAGAVTVAADSGVTLNSPKGAATTGKGEWLTMIKVGTDEWDVT